MECIGQANQAVAVTGCVFTAREIAGINRIMGDAGDNVRLFLACRIVFFKLEFAAGIKRTAIALGHDGIKPGFFCFQMMNNKIITLGFIIVITGVGVALKLVNQRQTYRCFFVVIKLRCGVSKL